MHTSTYVSSATQCEDVKAYFEHALTCSKVLEACSKDISTTRLVRLLVLGLLFQRVEPHHAPLVVQPLLEVPQPAAPEVGGTLAEEGRQLGLKQALNVGMSPLTKHGPHILVLKLPTQQRCCHILWAARLMCKQ